MSIRIDFLSYEGERNNERHPHAQFVLPIAGELEISIGGAEGRLTPSCAAFVAPGVPHSQLATVSNAFLIVTCDLAECGVPAAEQLAEQIFLPVSEATRHLIGFAELSRDRFSQPGTTQCWMPLLADGEGAFGSPTSDSTRAMITQETRSCLTVVFSFSARSKLEEALALTVKRFGQYANPSHAESFIIE